MRPLSTLLLALALAPACNRQTEFVPPPPPEVTVSPPLAQTIEPYIEYIGRTQAVDSIDIRARVKGFLLKRHYKPGDIVEKNELLFTIEPESFEAGLAAAEAEQAQEEANLQLADATLQRMEKALEKNAVSVLDVIQARADKVGAEAAVKEAEAQVSDRKLDLSYTSIYAPITGRISRDYVDPGNLVGSGENTLLATLVSDTPIHVYFNVDERSLIDYLGDRPREENRDDPEAKRPVVLTLADGTVFPHRGELDYASNRVNDTTGTLEVRAVFPNPDSFLIPGLFGRIRILLPEQPALLVPESAIQRDLAGNYLMVVDSDGKAVRRNVTLGVTEDDLRVIETGIEPGDLFVYRGLQRVRDGLAVVATEEAFPISTRRDTQVVAPAEDAEPVGSQPADDDAG